MSATRKPPGTHPKHAPETVDVPADFPRAGNFSPLPGAQPKFVADYVDGVFECGATLKEHRLRYTLCCEYIELLPAHCLKQLAAQPNLSVQDVLLRTGRALATRHFFMTGLEVDYIIERVALANNWCWTPGALWR